MGKVLKFALEAPKLICNQTFAPLRVAFREAANQPETQQAMADLVNSSIKHSIRAGFKHRFITILFVTVGDRVFCRRYSYNEPSWHGVFLKNPEGQILLDKTVVNIEARPPADLEAITPAVNKAYEDKLKELGASFLLDGAVEPRAEQSTMEIFNAHE